MKIPGKINENIRLIEAIKQAQGKDKNGMAMPSIKPRRELIDPGLNEKIPPVKKEATAIKQAT